MAGSSIVAGQFRTSAEAGFNGLRFGATGDWQQAPPYPSLKNVPEKELEFFLKLGDTIYADTETPALPGIVQARTLPQFRTKHFEVASERPEAPGYNFMRDLTASTAVLATIDDHEVVDNFAGGAMPGDSPDAPDVHPAEPPMFTDPVDFVNQTLAYQEAMQAYHEYHPLHSLEWDAPGDLRTDGRPMLYRYNTYGQDAAVIMLDSRSFRDAQLPPVTDPTDPEAVAAFITSTFTPGRTLLGASQLAVLKADLLAAQEAGITWKFVIIPEPIQNFGPINAEDRFEGYAVERNELLGYIDALGIDNVVFLAGDFHGTLVNNLTYGAPGALMPTNAIEIVTGPAAFYSGLFGPGQRG
jgi:phosphodiesterase/alkaline phosphatase D-like protein